MVEIKTNGNAFERPIKIELRALCVIYNARDVAKSRRYIRDPTATT